MFTGCDVQIFIAAFFKGNKHIFSNGCLSVRSVSTSTSHYSGQFPLNGDKARVQDGSGFQPAITEKHIR